MDCALVLDNLVTETLEFLADLLEGDQSDLIQKRQDQEC